MTFEGATTILPKYVYTQATEPADLTLGRLWYNTAEDKLYSSDGTNYNAIEINVDDVTLEVVAGTTQVKTSATYNYTPLGSILAWCKSFTGTPTIPFGWLECDGSVISDADSVFNGETLPDLNGDGRFLRGSSTSGTVQADTIKAHNHGLPTAVTSANSSGSAGGIPGSDQAGGSGTYGGMANNGSETETRPVNYSVVWIMRVK